MQKTNPVPLKTSIVIPCYNAALFVEQAIISCVKEGVPESNIIVIDDGSSDKTPEVLARYDGKIRVHRQKNSGASIARNVGLSMVQTPYMIFFDADDLYEGGIISALEEEMIRAGADIGFGPMQDFGPDSRYGRRTLPPEPSNPNTFLEAWLAGHTVQTNSHIWRTAFLKQIGGYPENMRTLEEIEVVARGILAGATLATTHVGQSLYINRGNPNRVSTGNSSEVIRSAINGFIALAPLLRTDGQRRALGRRFYLQSRSAFRQGYKDIGSQALALARANGFHGHIGSRSHKLLSRLLGLERKVLWFETERS